MGETVLVAGVGPNLGETVARRLVAAGHRVGLVARSGDRVESLADALGDDAVPAAADITDGDDLGSAVAELRAAFGSVDAVVHNANAPGGNPPAEATPERLAAVWRVRTLGLLHCLQAAPEAAAVVVSGTNYASGAAPEQVEWGSGAAATKGLARSVGEAGEAAVTYVEIGAAVAPPESTFPGAIGADRLADRYVEWLDRDPGFHAERVAPE